MDKITFKNFFDKVMPTEYSVAIKSLTFYRGYPDGRESIIVYVKFDVTDLEKWQKEFGPNDDGKNKSGNFFIF